MIYLVLIVGIILGIALHAWHDSLPISRSPDQHVVVRRFEYDSQQMIAYNSAREAIEHNTDKFQLLKLKYLGNAVFDKRGILMKYRSLHGHTLKFNYDMSRFDVIDPPKANEL